MSLTAWSKSSLGTLLDGCPHQWRLSKLEGLRDPGSPATVRGTGLHAGIERHERVRILRERDGATLPLPSFDEIADLGVQTTLEEAARLPEEQWALHDTTPGEVGDATVTALEHWWSAPIPAGQPGAGGSLRDRLMGWRPIAAEPYFNVQTVEGAVLPTHGYIDEVLYDHDSGCYVVVDHKTAATYGRWPHGGDGHETEGAVYVTGSTVSPSLPVTGDVRMEWHIARTTVGKTARFEPVRCVTRTIEPWDIKWMGDQVREAERMVQTGHLPVNPAWNLCSRKWCSFYEGCRVTGELAPENMAAPARPI